MKALSPSMKNTLKSTMILVIFAIASILLLSLANAYFPKAKPPELNLATVTVLNGLVPCGEPDNQSALDGGYFEMLAIDNLAAWNKEYGKNGESVAAVYRSTSKAEGAGTVFVETSTIGFKGGEIVLIAAISPGGILLKISARKIYDSYYKASDIERFNEFLTENSLSAKDLSAAVLKPFIYNAGATYTTDGLHGGISLAAAMFENIKMREGGGGNE